MTLDDLAVGALRDLADQARPAPDAYARVVRRYRRERRRRQAMVLMVVTGLIAALVVAVPGGGAPPAGHVDAQGTWVQRLVQSPVRGSVATGDPAYVRVLADTIADRQNQGEYEAKFQIKDARVLYVDDIGDQRVAFAALELDEPDPVTGTRYGGAWFEGQRGVDPGRLADRDAVSNTGIGLVPFVSNQVLGGGENGMPLVAIAPAECTVSSAAWPDLTDWRPEPTGSYLVRSALRPEWWRVTCGGRIREETPAPAAGDLGETPATESQLQGARGTPDPALAREKLVLMRAVDAYALSDVPRLLWGGRITWPEDPREHGTSAAGRTIVVGAPLVRGGWVGRVSLTLDDPGAGGPTNWEFQAYFGHDPTLPDAVNALRLAESSTILVTVPKAAVNVRAMRGGVVVAQATVADAAAVIPVADPETVQYQALDAAGRVVGTTALGVMPPDTSAAGWFEL
ncbi:MAG: hypothetical protein HOV79_13070 [Hamadaea sp.]|nr:hypothetical protein [Hamadaea sp.]